MRNFKKITVLFLLAMGLMGCGGKDTGTGPVDAPVTSTGPALIYPPADAVEIPRVVRFQWDTLPGRNYWLQWGPDTALLATSGGGNDFPQYTNWGEMVPGTVYFWRVCLLVAAFECDEGGWSETRRFTTTTASTAKTAF
jgi:hypothetical protein